MNNSDNGKHRAPDWLIRTLLESNSEWSQARLVLMHEFLSKYSLHDSEWVAFWLEPMYGEATAVIRWDTFWTKGRVAYPSSSLVDWPFLIIRFPVVYEARWSNLDPDAYADYISAAQSHEITSQEREAFLGLVANQPHLKNTGLQHLSDEALYSTVIACSSDAPLRIVHAGAVQLLCLSAAGEVIALPDM